ncbi:ABC transporter ATP-binding protein [Celeribacter indicus]|uniref:Glutathione import ATP-binding protein GsiA n=1 Tax=Celeribacter indicus TaxID=1208324 RepID=A0A0B5E466_9RHOB|nr:ABC transporter ATP-binding protein [Celeribacter indicus]AJE47851.1 glutathione import ATP-binding protein GsiA [Celeribacter indicus]SDW24939.1 peptide/nickel transport system ATP-binding protein [Celeribacter indicus]
MWNQLARKAVEYEPCADRSEDLLTIDGLRIDVSTPEGKVTVVDGVSWSAEQGKITALVGESGCGKSVTALAVMKLLRSSGRISKGEIRFAGQDLLKLGEEEMRRLRGRHIGMVFQEPMTSLNPVLSIETQITETLTEHLRMSRGEARERALELMNEVGIPDAERRLSQYPHQLSGGMRQRVMIAIALACNPKLIIADEPTTALDVTIQAQILSLLADLAVRHNIAMVVITHNMGVVARYADYVSVMYAGKIVESGPASEVFSRPSHPYTALLLKAVPRLDQPRQERMLSIGGMPPAPGAMPSGCRFAPRCPVRMAVCGEREPLLEPSRTQALSACHRRDEPLDGLQSAPASPRSPADKVPGAEEVLEVRDIAKHFDLPAGGIVRAVDGVSFRIERQRTLGLIGVSGCGKSTVGRMLLGLETPTSGSLRLFGEEMDVSKPSALRKARRDMQVIFQDPFSSLNPRMTVGAIIAEPLLVHGIVRRSQARDRVAQLLERVGLRPEVATRHAHQLSGGQRQRVGIARALTLNPKLLICDEPVSALDISVQGQIITLLEDLQDELGLSCLFIAHDLAVVRHISDEVAIMYFGRIVEKAPRDLLYANPLHPYTRALLDAAPTPDPVLERSRDHIPLKGELPSPITVPKGCPFHSRCPLASRECQLAVPPLREVEGGHQVACIKV